MTLEEKGASLRRTIIGTLAIIAGIITCTTTLIVGIDTACYNDVNYWLPIYPGSEVVEVKYDFFRPRGMGNTLMIFYTPDSENTIRQWYVAYRRTITQSREDIRDPNTRFSSLASTTYRIAPAEQGKHGSLIYHVSDCANQ